MTLTKTSKIWFGVLGATLVVILILVLVQAPKDKGSKNISEATAIQMSKTIADYYEAGGEYSAKADQMVSELLGAGWVYVDYGSVNKV